MEKEKQPGHGAGGGIPLPSGRFSPSSQSPPSKMESSSSVRSSPLENAKFSHDISGMSDFPPKNRGHRRAHSEILGLPDDLTFDSDLGVVGASDGPSLSDEIDEDILYMYLDFEKFASPYGAISDQLAGETSVRMTSSAPIQAESMTSGTSDKPRVRHQHSLSMDGSTPIKSEMLTSGTDGASASEAKKAMSAAKLAELAMIDPKRAKRIWANRQSAARSKERKMRYISELERKVKTLQTEATTLSAQLTVLQRDTHGLTAENNELKLRLQTMEQQVHLQDALNGALREELQRLKLATGQVPPNGGHSMNYGPGFGTTQQFYPHNTSVHTLMAAHQFQQLQIHPSQQQHHQSHQQQPPPSVVAPSSATSSATNHS